MAGYTRQSTFTDGDVITAAHSNDEFDQLVSSFDNATGHTHDGTSAEGAPITVVGPAQDVIVSGTQVLPKTNNTLDVGSATFKFKDGYFAGDVIANNIASTSYNSDIVPDTDDAYDLGSVTNEWKDLYIDGVANIDSLVADTADIDAGTIDGAVIGGATAAAGTFTDLTATGNTVLGDAATDTVTITADVASNIIPSADDTYDLGASGSEWKDIYIDGVAYVDSIAMPTTTVTDILDEDTMSSDSATALATQQSIKAYVDSQITANNELGELTDVTITTVADNEVLAYDSTSSEWINQTPAEAGLVSLTGTETLTNKTLTSAVLDTGVSGTAILDEDNMASDSATQLATQQSIKAYVDSQVGGVSTDLVNDTTPQLGGDLDVNGQSIVSVSAGDIAITPDTTGNVIIDGLKHPQADGTSGQVLQTDGLGQLSFATVLTDVVQDTTPQLGGTLDANGQLVQFGDSSGATDDRLQFGASQDMQLYHDGTNNKIDTAAAQELHVNSDDVLFYDNSGTTRTAIVSPGSTMNFQLYDSTGTVRVFAVNGSGNEFHRSVYIQDQRSLGFKEDSSNGNNYVAFQAPASVAANVTWTLPDADGTSGQFLQTNGSGTLSWADEADSSALAFAIALG
jgi:hypothetical protein